MISVLFDLLLDLLTLLQLDEEEVTWTPVRAELSTAAQAGGGNADSVGRFPHCVRTWPLKFSDTFRRKAAGAVSGKSLPKAGGFDLDRAVVDMWLPRRAEVSIHLRGKPHRRELRWNFNASGQNSYNRSAPIFRYGFFKCGLAPSRFTPLPLLPFSDRIN